MEKKIRVNLGKMVWYPLQTLRAIAMMISVICMVWVVASFVEIWSKNLNVEPIYSAWNYFNFLVK